MYAKIENGAVVEYPVQAFQIRGAFSNVSFPSPITDADVLPFGFEPYATAAKPAFDALTQKVEEAAPIKLDGTWVQQWAVIELYATQFERDAVIAADVEAKRIAAIPQQVTMRQARLALLGAGLLDTVETAIVAAGPAAKIEWDYATEVQRASGLVPAMAIALGMTEAQIDALFVTAASL